MGKDTELHLLSQWCCFPQVQGGWGMGCPVHPPWSHRALSAVGCVPAATLAKSQEET